MKKIAIATTHFPFITTGGAETHAENLRKNLIKGGFEAYFIKIPFCFAPPSEIRNNMEIWEKLNIDKMYSGFNIEQVICLKFPSFYLNHPNKVVWLLHQHRSVYDLWNTEYGDSPNNTEQKLLKEHVIEQDNKHLKTCNKIFTNSKTVKRRLKKYNDIDSTHLYHPPEGADNFYTKKPESFIFCISNFIKTKRQKLLIEAMIFVKSPITAVFAGGFDFEYHELCKNLSKELNVSNKVKFLGNISQEDKLDYFSRCLGVFFGPYNEDYGYITLEAMLASKPVITCKDSGGPTEFIIDAQNGFVVDPDPKEIARKIDWLYEHKNKSIEMGKNGLTSYSEKEISWEKVLDNIINV